MGFFSWKTMDTNRSISNVHSRRGAFPVRMYDDKGNVWVENAYDGYGVFGGKDFYELMAEMNGVTNGNANAKRLAGISMAFELSSNGTCPKYKYPTLVEGETGYLVDRIPQPDDEQGYFYDNEYYTSEDTDKDY